MMIAAAANEGRPARSKKLIRKSLSPEIDGRTRKESNNKRPRALQIFSGHSKARPSALSRSFVRDAGHKAFCGTVTTGKSERTTPASRCRRPRNPQNTEIKQERHHYFAEGYFSASHNAEEGRPWEKGGGGEWEEKRNAENVLSKN